MDYNLREEIHNHKFQKPYEGLGYCEARDKILTEICNATETINALTLIIYRECQDAMLKGTDKQPKPNEYAKLSEYYRILDVNQDCRRQSYHLAVKTTRLHHRLMELIKNEWNTVVCGLTDGEGTLPGITSRHILSANLDPESRIVVHDPLECHGMLWVEDTSKRTKDLLAIQGDGCVA